LVSTGAPPTVFVFGVRSFGARFAAFVVVFARFFMASLLGCDGDLLVAYSMP
jgi:hypothetical protein